MHVVAAIIAALIVALAGADPAAAAERYTVAPHDTLFSIARRFGVPLPLLANVNGIHDPSRIRVGDVLVIPDRPAGTVSSPAATTAAAVPPHPAPSSRLGPSGQVSLSVPAVHSDSYFVRPGDTLYHIAITHGTTVQALRTANGLTSPSITAGQILRLPGSAPVSASQAAPAPVSPPDAPSPGPTASDAGRPADPAVPVVPAAPSGSPGYPSLRRPAAAAPAGTALAAQVRASALRLVGTRYVWGGATAAGVDCSGLVYLVYSPYVRNLPRTSYEQWTAGVAVDRADLAPGDLVFFNTDGSGASHVGIYIGDGQFVHPAASAQRVTVDRLDAAYYLTHYLGARRVL